MCLIQYDSVPKSLPSSRGSHTEALCTKHDAASFYPASILAVRILRCKSEEFGLQSDSWSAKYPSKMTILKSIGRVLWRTRGGSGRDGSASPLANENFGALFPAQPSVDEIKRKWRSQQIAAQEQVMKEQGGAWLSRLMSRRGALHVLHQQRRH